MKVGDKYITDHGDEVEITFIEGDWVTYVSEGRDVLGECRKEIIEEDFKKL